jgi:hypothetical protein
VPDWRDFVIAFFSSIWIANVYTSLFALIWQDAEKEKTEIELVEQKIK